MTKSIRSDRCDRLAMKAIARILLPPGRDPNSPANSRQKKEGDVAMSDSGSKLSVEDRLDIQELFAKYAWSIDMGDIDGIVACFAEDGSLDHLWQGKLQGKEKLRKAFEELWYDRPSWWIGRQHLANHFLITREGEGARVKAFLDRK